jgi:hypothetical protein
MEHNVQGPLVQSIHETGLFCQYLFRFLYISLQLTYKVDGMQPGLSVFEYTKSRIDTQNIKTVFAGG